MASVPPIERRDERRANGEGRDPPAALAGLRARMLAARAHGDDEAEAGAAGRLARRLLERESNLDEATTAGRRALQLRAHDLELRSLLTQTLEGLGEHGLAAATLRPVVDAACAQAKRDEAALDAAVQGLLRLGDLHLRSGDVEGALESYRYVSVLAQERPSGQERLALVHASAPDALPAEIAARAYLGAAKKHQLGGDEGRAMEALSRAFEVDPRSALPAAVLADALEDIGRLDAADAVRAEHGWSQGSRSAAAAVHVARIEKSSIGGDRATRLAAEVDLLVDVVLHEPERSRVDALAGLPFEVLLGLSRAIRRAHALGAAGTAGLAALAEECTGAERVELLSGLGARDPADEHALAALREHARLRRDPGSVVDALLRGLRGAELDSHVVGARAAELAGWADEQLDDPNIAAWAWRKLLERIPEDRRARDELTRLQPRIARASQRQEDARNRATSEDPVVRATALCGLAEILLSRPDRAADAVDVLVSALRADPGRASPLIARAIRCLLPAEVEAVVSAAVAIPELHATAVPLQLELRVRRGDLRGAAQAAQGSEEASVLELALSVLTGGLPELGRALERYAPTLTVPRERAALLAGAARAFRTASLPIDARRAAEAALRLDSREARGAIELAELAAGSGADAVGPALASLALERALGLVGARGRWSLALAALAERDEELTLAAAWTRRAWALRPADPEVATAWLRRAVALGDLDLCAEVLETVARSVARLSAIAEPLAHTLRRLASDPEGREAYSAAARLLLSLGAARYPAIFTALRENAATHPDLAIAALERWIASSAPVSERGPALLEIAQIAREGASGGGDESRAVEALARLLEDPDAPRALREEARKELLSLESTPLDPDAELLVRGVVADARLGKASEGLAT
ncbi:MAG: hypothetical protein JNL79_40465, partial [Myxococcales bacterium]|nr:hypothetical protein [Myxococcales bacterium]